MSAQNQASQPANTAQTRQIVVTISDNDTWDDIVGGDPAHPKYTLCVSRPVSFAGGIQSKIVKNNPLDNKVEKSTDGQKPGGTISLDWTVPSNDDVMYYLDAETRQEEKDQDFKPHPQEVALKDVYTVQKNSEGQITQSKASITDSWGQEIVDQIDAKDFDRIIGLENHLAVHVKLYEAMKGTQPDAVTKDQLVFDSESFWVPGKGVITPSETNHIVIWFELRGTKGKVSVVDYSDKCPITFKWGSTASASVEYTEDKGWPTNLAPF